MYLCTCVLVFLSNASGWAPLALSDTLSDTLSMHINCNVIYNIIYNIIFIYSFAVLSISSSPSMTLSLITKRPFTRTECTHSL